MAYSKAVENSLHGLPASCCTHTRMLVFVYFIARSLWHYTALRTDLTPNTLPLNHRRYILYYNISYYRNRLATIMRQRPHGIFIIAVLMLLLACASLLKTYISTTVNNVHIDWRQVHASEGIFLGDLTPTASLDDEDSSSAQSSFHHARLRKRQVRRSAFQKALKTGQKILSSFDGPARQKPRAAFDKTSDLEDWGWKSTALDAQTIRQTLGNFAAVLEAKGISVSAPTMRGVRMIHAKETVHGGVKYPVSDGNFHFLRSCRGRQLAPVRHFFVRADKAGDRRHVRSDTRP